MMNSSKHGESFLLSQFRDFYSEVIRLKRTIQSGTWVYRAESQEDGTLENNRVNTAWQRLLSVLEQQAFSAASQGGEYGTALYKEAQYAMASFADEIFLHLDWVGKDAWNSHLLESKLFDTNIAGEEIFQRVERLLHDRNPVHTELAKVYFMILALGFQGRFRGLNDRSPIDNYQRQLFSFIMQREPSIFDESMHLFPEAYMHVLEQGQNRKLPNANIWKALPLLVVLIWVVLAHMFWSSFTGDLKEVLNHILIAQ